MHSHTERRAAPDGDNPQPQRVRDTALSGSRVPRDRFGTTSSMTNRFREPLVERRAHRLHTDADPYPDMELQTVRRRVKRGGGANGRLLRIRVLMWEHRSVHGRDYDFTVIM